MRRAKTSQRQVALPLEAIAPVFILLGRYGDLIQNLGCFHEIWKRLGERARVLVSPKYLDLFDGVSYAQAVRVKGGWFDALPQAQQIAKTLTEGRSARSYWTVEPQHADAIGYQGRPWAILQNHGLGYECDMSLDPDYGTAMARRAGFTRDEWLRFRPLFDKRDPEREAALVERFLPKHHKPLLLYSFASVSSPFIYQPELMRLLKPLRKYFFMLDLGDVRAERIYDVLALIERARGLLSIDSAPFHLASATRTPSILLRVDGWGSSVPKGNCSFHCRYSETLVRLDDIYSIVETWKA